MANRFRAAIKGTSQEILSAGKVNVSQEESLTAESTVEVREVQPKEVESKAPEMQEQVAAPVEKKVEYVVTGNISFEQVSEFLKQKVNNKIFELRMSKIKDILNALIDYKNTHKPVMLCDSKENIPYWIAAVKMSLSKKVGDTLVFRNYESDRNSEVNNCLIFVDIEEERMNPKNYSEDDPMVVVFNFAKGTSPRVIFNSKYSELAQVGYLLNDQSFYMFENFLDEFSYTKIGPDIDSCLELFYLINNGIEYMDYNSIESAMNFIEKYAVKDTYKMLLQKMNVIISRVGSDIENRTAFILISTMIGMASRLGENVFYNMVCKFFYGYLQGRLARTDESRITEVYKLFNDVKNLEVNEITKFAAYSLGEENIRKLSTYVSDYDSKYARFYLSIVLDIIKSSDAQLVDNHLFEDFVGNCADRLVKSNFDLRTIIGGFTGNLNYMSSLIALYYSKTLDHEALRKDAVKFYLEKLEENGDSANEIRNIIFGLPKGKDLIFDEFAMKLSASNKKDEFFWQYSAQVFENIKDFKGKYFAEALQAYLNLIENTPIFKDECLKIITMASRNEVELDNSKLTAIIEEYENQIPLSVTDEKTKEVMIALTNIKKTRNIVTLNNVSALTEFGIKLEAVASYKELQALLSGNTPDLTKVSEYKYREFLEWTMNLLLTNKDSRITDILNFYKKVTAMKENGSEKFVEYILSIDKIKAISTALDSMKAKQIQFYMIIIMEYLIRNDHHWTAKEEYEKFLSNCVSGLSSQSKELHTVLDSIVDAKEYFANILVRYYSSLKKNSSEAVKFFLERSKKNGEAWANDVRLFVSAAENGFKFLIDEFKALFDSAKEKNEYFWNYNSSVFDKMPKYKVGHFSEAFEYYLKHIEGTDRYTEECMNILELVADDKVKLSPAILGVIIKEYESTIPLMFPAPETISVIEEIEGIKERNKVVVTPHLGEIIRLGVSIQSAEDAEVLIQLLKTTRVRLNEVTNVRYTEYLNWCLPHIFSKVNILENDNLIRRVFYVEANKDIFNKIYNDLLMNQIRSGKIAANKNDLIVLLKELNLEAAELCSIVISYYSKQKEKGDTKDSVGLFIDLIDSKSPEKAAELRKHLSTLKYGNGILFEEYASNLAIASNPQRFFWNYVKNVFNDISGYKGAYFVEAIGRYLDSIDGTQDYPKACYELLAVMKEDNLTLGSQMETRILTGCEMMLSLSKSYEDQEDLIREMEDIKVRRNIKTSPDMVALVRFATEFEKVKEMDDMHKLLNNTNLYLENMDISKYEELLDHFLPRAAMTVNTWTLHAVIKKVFCIEKRKALFFTKYLAILADNIENEKALGAKIFAEFIIYFFNAREQHGEDLYVQVKTTLVNMLYRLSPFVLKDINNSLKAEISGMRNKDMIIRDWDQMYTKVTPAGKQEGGLFGRLFDRR
ncbi:MAG: hypothetical protein Q8930_05550 [Bacillota bacterium]|nr:hypothetical protein [Bacillota bacterium]